MRYHPRIYKVVLALTVAAFLGVIALGLVVATERSNERDAVCEAISRGRGDNRAMWTLVAQSLEDQGNIQGADTVVMWLDVFLKPIECIDGEPIEQGSTSESTLP